MPSFLSIIMCHHVTVSKLAWPASSVAAALAASCLSEWPVPWVAGTSAREVRHLHINIKQLKFIFKKKTLNQTVLQSQTRYLLTALGYGFL